MKLSGEGFIVAWGLIILLLLFVAGTTGCSWTPTQQWTFTGAVACNGYDAYQTSWGVNHGYSEGNPLLGSQPSDARIAVTKTTILGAAFALEDARPQDRIVISSLLLAGCGAVVWHNYSVEH